MAQMREVKIDSIDNRDLDHHFANLRVANRLYEVGVANHYSFHLRTICFHFFLN